MERSHRLYDECTPGLRGKQGRALAGPGSAVRPAQQKHCLDIDFANPIARCAWSDTTSRPPQWNASPPTQRPSLPALPVPWYPYCPSAPVHQYHRGEKPRVATSRNRGAPTDARITAPLVGGRYMRLLMESELSTASAGPASNPVKRSTGIVGQPSAKHADDARPQGIMGGTSQRLHSDPRNRMAIPRLAQGAVGGAHVVEVVP